MQLDKGLRVLANPTRLRVLALPRDPSRLDGPPSADGRPLGITAKGLAHTPAMLAAGPP